jgi:DNA-directed RNA polymerase subunit K/omega
MTAAVAPETTHGEAVDPRLLGRFHVAAVAFQRARQLQNNARPRVEVDGHKVHRIALMEVMIGAVEWSIEPAVVPLDVKPAE